MLFDLRSLPDEKARPRIFLMQLPFKTKARLNAVSVPTTLASLEGNALALAKPALGKIMGEGKLEEYLVSDSSFVVNEENGIRLLVMFLALSGARASEKVQQAVEAIMKMTQADAEYWIEKLRNLVNIPPEKAEKVRKSFFEMLDDA